MAPTQNIIADNSPKKNKKKNNKKNRNVSTSEKEVEGKVIDNVEKEVCVEKKDTGATEEKDEPAPIITSLADQKDPEPVPVQQPSPPREICLTSMKQAKNENNENKKAEMELYKSTVIENNKVDITEQGGAGQSSLAGEVAKARQLLKNSLQCMDSVAALAGSPNVEVMNKINSLEKENRELKKTVDELRKSFQELKVNFDSFTSKFSAQAAAPAAAAAKAPAPAPAAAKDDSDDGVDLFGSDDEEESAEAARLREERLAAYNAKKSKKPVLIAKSNIILDVKPWDDETDMKAMEAAVRTVTTDGLLWGAAKLVPLAYGIHKLQISCVVEDDKVSIDWLTEELEKIEDYVQSVDIAAFNKV